MRKLKIWGLPWLCLCFFSCAAVRKQSPDDLSVTFLIAAGQYDLAMLPLQPYAIQNVTDECGEAKCLLLFHLHDSRQMDLLAAQIDQLQSIGAP